MLLNIRLYTYCLYTRRTSFLLFKRIFLSFSQRQWPTISSLFIFSVGPLSAINLLSVNSPELHMLVKVMCSQMPRPESVVTICSG